jgi:hypothetical protein
MLLKQLRKFMHSERGSEAAATLIDLQSEEIARELGAIVKVLFLEQPGQEWPNRPQAFTSGS